MVLADKPEAIHLNVRKGHGTFAWILTSFLQWLSGYIPADELIRQHRILLRTDWQERRHVYIGTDSCPAWSDDQ